MTVPARGERSRRAADDPLMRCMRLAALAPKRRLDRDGLRRVRGRH